MQAFDGHDDACFASSTGPIRRVPSVGDTTRVNSFPGNSGGHPGHYAPYGSVFAAVSTQHAAVAAAAAGAVAAATTVSDPLDPAQISFSCRKPPLRQHSYDTRMMQQHQWQKQQQHQQHRSMPSAAQQLGCARPGQSAEHPVNCRCDDCAAAMQRWLQYHYHHPQHHPAAAVATGVASVGHSGEVSCHHMHHAHFHQQQTQAQAHAQQQQTQPPRLAAMFSGPPTFGSSHDAAAGPDDTSAATAAGTALLHGCAAPWEHAAGAAAAGPAGVNAFSFTGPFSQGSGSQHHQHQHQQCGLSGFGSAGGSAGPAPCADEALRRRQQQQQFAMHPQHGQQHQLLQRALSREGGSQGFCSMHSTPPCTFVPVGPEAAGTAAVAAAHAAPAAAATAAAGATAACLMSLHQIPSGLAAIRPRPQPTACIAHTAREQPQQQQQRRPWPAAECDGCHTSAAAAARAAAAAAAGRDMVSTRAMHQHQHTHLHQHAQTAPSSSDQEPEAAYKQPQLRQQELQLLLQHQLKQLVPGAGSGPTGAAGCRGNQGSGDGLQINLQDPAILLELLRHSGMCKVPEDACALGWRCTWVKRLWIHMHTCRSNDACASIHCRLGKQVLPHYKECSDLSCACCARVRSYDKALQELRALAGRAASMAGGSDFESVDSQGSADNTPPSTVFIAGEDDEDNYAAGAAAGRAGAGGAAAAAMAMSPALSVTSKPTGRVGRVYEEEEVEQGVDRRQQYFPQTW